MYLIREKKKGELCYTIRESYQEGDLWLHRDLMDLGDDPSSLIHYPGSYSFYIDPSVEEGLMDAGACFEDDELEEIFYPFLDPEIQHVFKFTESRRSARRVGKKIHASDFHEFDRRRMHYLRYGQMDQRRLGAVSPQIFRDLQYKSRDEIERFFMSEERRVLKDEEYKSYVFVILDLQRYFSSLAAVEMPQSLDQDEVDLYFTRRLCRLKDDEGLWAGFTASDSLQEYLIRYVIFFYDNEYARSRYLDEIYQNWINSRRDYKPPMKRRREVLSDAAEVFGLGEARLKKLTARELARLYRKKARDLHPDRGGDHDRFVRLTEVYEQLKAL